MHHVLKTHPAQFRAALSGVKPFEVRKDDRSFQTGDTVELVYYDPATAIGPGRVMWAVSPASEKPPEITSLNARVTYVLRGGQYGVETGYVVLGLAFESANAPIDNGVPDFVFNIEVPAQNNVAEVVDKMKAMQDDFVKLYDPRSKPSGVIVTPDDIVREAFDIYEGKAWLNARLMNNITKHVLNEIRDRERRNLRP